MHSIAALLQQRVQPLDRDRRLDMLPAPRRRYVDLQIVFEQLLRLLPSRIV
jgi:hypothetical protein